MRDRTSSDGIVLAQGGKAVAPPDDLTAHITNTCFNVAAAVAKKRRRKGKKLAGKNRGGAESMLAFDESRFVKTLSELPGILERDHAAGQESKPRDSGN